MKEYSQLTQNKTTPLNMPRNSALHGHSVTQEGLAQATEIQLRILLNEWREGKDMEMFVSTSGL